MTKTTQLDTKPSKVKLAAKLLLTRNYILIADNEAYTSIEMPKTGDDMAALSWRRNVMESLKKSLDSTIKITDKYIDKLLAEPQGTPKKKPTRRSKGKKIEVKQG